MKHIIIWTILTIVLVISSYVYGFLFFPNPTNLQVRSRSNSAVSRCCVAKNRDLSHIYTIGIQVTCGISSPIQTKPRKIFISQGFQFNYALPISMQQFEHPAYVEGYLQSRSLNVTAADKSKRNAPHLDEVRSDVSAGQLYRTIMTGLRRYHI